MARTSPIKFLQEVRAEGQKVTWPTRRETMITTLMVFIMTAVRVDLLSDLRPDHAVRRDLHHRLVRTDGGTDASIMTKRWYIVQAYSNFEQKVAEFDPRAGQAAPPRALLR